MTVAEQLKKEQEALALDPQHIRRVCEEHGFGNWSLEARIARAIGIDAVFSHTVQEPYIDGPLKRQKQEEREKKDRELMRVLGESKSPTPGDDGTPLASPIENSDGPDGTGLDDVRRRRSLTSSRGSYNKPWQLQKHKLADGAIMDVLSKNSQRSLQARRLGQTEHGKHRRRPATTGGGHGGDPGAERRRRQEARMTPRALARLKRLTAEHRSQADLSDLNALLKEPRGGVKADHHHHGAGGHAGHGGGGGGTASGPRKSVVDLRRNGVNMGEVKPGLHHVNSSINVGALLSEARTQKRQKKYRRINMRRGQDTSHLAAFRRLHSAYADQGGSIEEDFKHGKIGGLGTHMSGRDSPSPPPGAPGAPGSQQQGNEDGHHAQHDGHHQPGHKGKPPRSKTAGGVSLERAERKRLALEHKIHMLAKKNSLRAVRSGSCGGSLHRESRVAPEHTGGPAMVLHANRDDQIVKRGLAEFGKGNYRNALSAYSSVVAEEDGTRTRSWHVAAHFHRAVALDRFAKQTSQALPLLRAVHDYGACIKADERCSVAYFNRGVAWSRLGQDDFAAQDFTAAMRSAQHQRRDAEDAERKKRQKKEESAERLRAARSASKAAAAARKRRQRRGSRGSASSHGSRARPPGPSHAERALNDLYEDAKKNRALCLRRCGNYAEAAKEYAALQKDAAAKAEEALKRTRTAEENRAAEAERVARLRQERLDEAERSRSKLSATQAAAAQEKAAAEAAQKGGGGEGDDTMKFASQRALFEAAMKREPRDRTRADIKHLIAGTDSIKYLLRFPQEALGDVWSTLRYERFGIGQRIIDQGDPAQKFYIILKGNLSVRHWLQADTEAAKKQKAARLARALARMNAAATKESNDRRRLEKKLGKSGAAAELKRQKAAADKRKAEMMRARMKRKNTWHSDGDKPHSAAADEAKAHKKAMEQGLKGMNHSARQEALRVLRDGKADAAKALEILKEEHLRGNAELLAELETPEEIELATIPAGAAFGELGLIFNQPRSASIVAIAVVELLTLTKEDYMRTVFRFDKAKLDERCAFLRSTGCFNKWDDASLMKLTGKAQEKQFKPGQTVVHQGQQAKNLWFVKSGFASLVRTLPDGENKYRVAQVSRGDVFAEIVLLGMASYIKEKVRRAKRKLRRAIARSAASAKLSAFTGYLKGGAKKGDDRQNRAKAFMSAMGSSSMRKQKRAKAKAEEEAKEAEKQRAQPMFDADTMRKEWGKSSPKHGKLKVGADLSALFSPGGGNRGKKVPEGGLPAKRFGKAGSKGRKKGPPGSPKAKSGGGGGGGGGGESSSDDDLGPDDGRDDEDDPQPLVGDEADIHSAVAAARRVHPMSVVCDCECTMVKIDREQLLQFGAVFFNSDTVARVEDKAVHMASDKIYLQACADLQRRQRRHYKILDSLA